MVGAAMMRGQANGGHAIARCCLQLKFLSWLGGLWRRAPLGQKRKRKWGVSGDNGIIETELWYGSCIMCIDDQRVKSQDTKSRVKTKKRLATAESQTDEQRLRVWRKRLVQPLK